MQEESEKDSFAQYYTCYFNNYFGIEPEEESSQRKAFVQKAVETAILENDPEPSVNCVEWICSDKVHMQVSKIDLLEILAYYASNDTTVESWQKCLNDEKDEFKRRNYTFSKVGK